MKKDILITGGAGFIGSHLAGELIKDNDITILDNMTSGNIRNLKQLSNYRLIKGDLNSYKKLDSAMESKDSVFHLAANPDVRKGFEDTELDLKQETIHTYRVLELMRRNDVKEMIFASSSAIYGNHKWKMIRENAGPCLPTSLYGAGKLASEGLISAYAELYGIKAWIFRFANVVGSNGTHGILYDFINKLKEDQNTLEVLGDGNQQKPYIHVSDLISGILHGYKHSNSKINLYNISSKGTSKVSDIANMVINKINPKANITYTGGKGGWPGDIPVYVLDSNKLRKLGWSSKYTSDEAVSLSIRELLNEI